METIRQNFVVIKRRDFVALIGDADMTEQRWCPVVQTTLDVNDLIQATKNEKERNNAITATRFNLPFVIGDHLVIPVNTNQSIDNGRNLNMTIFGGQILNDNVGE